MNDQPEAKRVNSSILFPTGLEINCNFIIPHYFRKLPKGYCYHLADDNSHVAFVKDHNLYFYSPLRLGGYKDQPGLPDLRESVTAAL